MATRMKYTIASQGLRVTKIYNNGNNSHFSNDKAVTSLMLDISNAQDVIMRFYLVNATKQRVGLLSYTQLIVLC